MLVYAAVLFGIQSCVGYESSQQMVTTSSGYLANVGTYLERSNVPQTLIEQGWWKRALKWLHQDATRLTVGGHIRWTCR
jgi:hypothetical protein